MDNIEGKKGIYTFGVMLRPGFEPGSAAREAAILDRTILPELVFIVFDFVTG